MLCNKKDRKIRLDRKIYIKELSYFIIKWI